MVDVTAEAISSTKASLFDLSATNIEGKLVNLSEYKNKKAIIIVNVACKCGLTSNHYKQLVDLYKTYQAKGLEILAFPCNQFGQQEPWEAKEIVAYTKDNFGVSFPLFAKIDVNGPNTHDVYRFLRANSVLAESKDAAKKIPWNFGKFLIDGKTGQVNGYFTPKEDPNVMIPNIQKLLE